MPKQGKILPGVRVNKVDLARVFGVEPAVIDAWVSKGLPCVKKPRPLTGTLSNERIWVFDTAEAIEWRISVSRMDYDI
jgi:phage terminase Nu1 subunit (DNA packaging protein)